MEAISKENILSTYNSGYNILTIGIKRLILNRLKVSVNGAYKEFAATISCEDIIKLTENVYSLDICLHWLKEVGKSFSEKGWCVTYDESNNLRKFDKIKISFLEK